MVLPLFAVKWTDRSCPQPPRNAMEMEGMVADAPRDGALLRGIGDLVCLAVNARLHDVVLADGAVVYGDVPGPEGDGVPSLHFKALALV